MLGLLRALFAAKALIPSVGCMDTAVATCTLLGGLGGPIVGRLIMGITGVTMCFMELLLSLLAKPLTLQVMRFKIQQVLRSNMQILPAASMGQLGRLTLQHLTLNPKPQP